MNDNGDPRLRFGDFELDPRTEELCRDGRSVHLPPQPARVLALLASRPGEIVLRDEIRRHIWGDSFVDADAGLNVCIRQIRAALGDQADAPAYVETVPRKGYRFVAAVDSGVRTPRRPDRRRLAAAAAAALGIAALGIGAIGLRTETATPARGEKLPADPAAREAYLEKALVFDPVSARLGDIGWLYELLGDHATALEQCRKALRLEPDHLPSLLCLTATHRSRGEKEQGIAAARRLMELRDAPPERIAGLADGFQAFDEWHLDRILARQASQYVSPCQIGVIYAKLGDATQAFAHLEAAFEQRSSLMLFLETEPTLEPLRADPRYAALIAKVRAETRREG